MYAIIATGGKQYRVQPGEILDVELLELAEAGSKMTFDQVLFFHDGQNLQVGVPHVPNCAVHAEFVAEVKGPKVIAYKYKKRKNYHRTVGHRQRYSRVKITEIAIG